MNERIKLLADRAEDYATVEYEKWIPTPDFSGIPHIRKIFNEKFAELIVRECVQVCADRGKHHDGLYSVWADDCSKRIGKHFGVEE